MTSRNVSLERQFSKSLEPVLEPEACRTWSRPRQKPPQSLGRTTHTPARGQTMSEDVSSGGSGDEVYDRFSPARKHLIVMTTCLCGFLNPIGSTALLVAVPEIAESFNTTGAIVNVSNALFFVFMAMSPMFWGPLLGLVGRRWVFISCSALVTAFTVGTAVAPNLTAFFIFRMLGAFQGTAFLVGGSVVIGDLYPAERRGTALSWFLCGIVGGPSIAPVMGGVVINFTSWRAIFWVLAAMALVALIMVLLFLPETMHEKPDTFEGLKTKESIKVIVSLLNPWRVVKPLLIYPNLWIAALAVSAFLWNMYSLLTPIRYVLNPRFDITNPIESSLFFLPPGAGYVTGTFFGGRWSDYNVNKYIRKRGRRVAEDRLNAVIWPMAIAVPGSMFIYGWAVEKEVGGIPLVVVAMFFQGFLQLFCLSSLNTYCVDVMQEKGQSSVVVAGNYLTRYLFAAAASAACLPAIEAIGVGWFSTISGLFLTATAGMVWLLARYGEQWRKAIDAREEER